MFYLIFGVFLIVFNILPFIACRCCINWMAATVQPTGMGPIIFLVVIYFLIYILRFFLLLIGSIMSCFLKIDLSKLYKHNSIIMLLLLMLDFFLYNLLGIFFQIDFFKKEGLLRYYISYSLVATYFPIWLVFWIRNTVYWIKNKYVQ